MEILCPVATTSTSLFFYTYVLGSLKDKNRYIGFINKLNYRLEKHRKGFNISTKPRLPMKLIYFEAYTNENDAKRREEYFKATYGRRFLAKTLKTYYQQSKL